MNFTKGEKINQHFNYTLKAPLPLSNTYAINSKIKQFYFTANNYDGSFNETL